MPYNITILVIVKETIISVSFLCVQVTEWSKCWSYKDDEYRRRVTAEMENYRDYDLEKQAEKRNYNFRNVERRVN